MYQVVVINGVPAASKSEIEAALAGDPTQLALDTATGQVPLADVAAGEYPLAGPSVAKPAFFAVLKVKAPKDDQPRRYRLS